MDKYPRYHSIKKIEIKENNSKIKWIIGITLFLFSIYIYYTISINNSEVIIPKMLKNKATNKCINKTIKLVDCKNDESQLWETTDKTIKNIETNKCLSTDNNNIYLESCNNTQNLTIDNVGLIKHNDKCLEVKDHKFIFAPCDINNNFQIWI